MNRKETIDIKGMSCGHCVKAVETALEKLELENYNVEIGQAEVEYDDSKVSKEEIEKAIDEAGYDTVK